MLHSEVLKARTSTHKFFVGHNSTHNMGWNGRHKAKLDLRAGKALT